MDNSFYNNLLTTDEKKTIDEKILGLYKLHGHQPENFNNLIKSYLLNTIMDKIQKKTFITPIPDIYKFV